MGNNKKRAKSAAENPIIIIAVFLVLVAITLIASFAVAKANKIDITELVLILSFRLVKRKQLASMLPPQRPRTTTRWLLL